MMLAARMQVTYEADVASFRDGCDALMAFADRFSDAIDPMAALVMAGQAFDVVQRREDDLRLVIVASRPSKALLRVIRAFGSAHSVNAILHAYGFDPELRAAA